MESGVLFIVHKFSIFIDIVKCIMRCFMKVASINEKKPLSFRSNTVLLSI